jgi:methyltransferase (TIGR00027 family)
MTALPALDASWRMHPQLMTERLRELVPMLAMVDWTVVEIGDGCCVSRLPLSPAATNHNGTHQAALIMMAADYTGGIAVASLLHGYPLMGVHPLLPEPLRPDGSADDRAAAWSIELSMRYLRPSTDDLLISSTVPEAARPAIRERFLNGRAAVQRVRCECTAEGELIAEADNTYLIQTSRGLRPATADARPSILYAHLTTASARLIAGSRARSSAARDPRTADVHRQMAGKHGLLLAERFGRLLPELDDLVASRSEHLDRHLARELPKIRQLVFIGVGLDPRPALIARDHPELSVVELDLPQVLEERSRRLRAAGLSRTRRRYAVPVDLNHEPLRSVLDRVPGLDPSRATAFVCEGLSMYLEEPTVRAMLGDLRAALANRDSTVWMDTVDAAMIDGDDTRPSIRAFLENLARLGEPFVFGLRSTAHLFGAAGFSVESTSASSYLHAQSDPVFERYRFHVLRPDATLQIA